MAQAVSPSKEITKFDSLVKKTDSHQSSVTSEVPSTSFPLLSFQRRVFAELVAGMNHTAGGKVYLLRKVQLF